MGRPLFAGHVAGFRPMKRKNILHRMIIRVILHFFSLRNRSTGLFDKGNVVAVATRQIVQSHSLLLTDNSRAAGISKFPLSKVLTCLRSSNPRGVNTKSSFSTGSMFRTIPTREKRLIITDKTEMDFSPKRANTQNPELPNYWKKNTTVEHLHVRPPLAKVTDHLAS